MRQSLGLVSLVVRDYDEALGFFLGKLGFELVEDTLVPAPDKRWVVVRPRGGTGACLLLAKASTKEQEHVVGGQTGGRVFLFLYTDNFWRDYERYRADGVEFVRPPEEQPHGLVAVFKDPLWKLLGPLAAELVEQELVNLAAGGSSSQGKATVGHNQTFKDKR